MTTPTYYCNIVGRDVEPRSVGSIEAVRGVRYAWFTCSCCDTNGRTRSEAGFDPQRPGVHVVFFDTLPTVPTWHSRFVRRQETQP